MHSYSITGNLVDIFEKRIYPATIYISNGKIVSVDELPGTSDRYILPGFVDAHVHIESSMLVPTAFARLAVIHGTVATVSDPHEIANVCGTQGVQYMIDNSKRTPFKFFFGAPSCVPATTFETAGATLDAYAVEDLLASEDIWYLSEMMNYPGVLNKDREVMAKIAAAKKLNKPVDGHAPGLHGAQATAYASAGISTDHECFTLDEALDKIAAGMNIIIREGSAARNFEALHELISKYPDRVMFCSDDKHPDELVVSHINALVKRALAKGHDLFDILKAASVNPVLHYNLPVGMLRPGDAADFIIVDNTTDFNVLQTYIGGEVVAEKGKTLLPHVNAANINNFNTDMKKPADFVVPASEPETSIRVIEAIEGQLVTNELIVSGKVVDNNLVSDVTNDVLKIAVVNRYAPGQPIAKAFIKNFGLKRGALASTVAHDCHNIIAIGVDDDSLCAAVNALIKAKGGISVAENAKTIHCMPLPVGGLMATDDGYKVAAEYSKIDAKAKQLGTPLKAPFMTLSFMALLVIPALKLSDKGLFDGAKFSFTNVEA
ncbi:adenine deaminase [Polluticoccus soli]|uniref:adenine deaminase n=1 Tax=Polluticoccus soli TaxID=3034150 RepID=UPI0023E1EB4F|nr:adenine deaminase [Flavipsychrobacter sp. JY13-12]